ncbi:unnamed protein product [Cuscuta europaea]|uniref:Uncharacterized protein n=1 Tax=Cuscuta europaea TaxID=41803 RepID=A0A9P0YM79_CUSEU|nr:unnamed protein product [Cuscuta europaea]
MDTEVDCNLLSNGQNLSQHRALENLDLVYSLKMDKQITDELLKLPSKPTAFIIPATPDSKQGVEECANGFASSTSCLPRALCFTSSQSDIISSNGHSPRTPKDNVFDPFAPGPDHLLLAPLGKKHGADSRSSVARMLKFEESAGYKNDSISVDSMPDEVMLETLYRMLLEVILSKHREEVLAGISNPQYDSDGDRTPTGAPAISGITDSCPGAPKKTTRKFINIEKGLCKKLEF